VHALFGKIEAREFCKVRTVKVRKTGLVWTASRTGHVLPKYHRVSASNMINSLLSESDVSIHWTGLLGPEEVGHKKSNLGAGQ